MKYVLFTVALAVGVPVMAGLSSMSVKMKHLLFTLLIVSLMFGTKFSINIMSMEYYRGPVRGYEVTLADLIALGLVIGMLLRSGSKIVFFPRFFWIFLLFFIFSIINVAGSDYTIYGWFVIWQLFRMGLLYWCTVNFFATDDDGKGALDAVMWGYVFTGLIMMVFTFKQKYLDGIYRTKVFFDHSNTVPSFVLIILAVLLTWSLLENRLSFIKHYTALIAALGLVFAVLGTSSRTGMVTAGGSVVSVLVLVNLRRSGKGVGEGIVRTSRIRLATIFLILAMLVGTLFVIDTVIYRFLNAPESSEQARNEFEVAAIMMADDYSIGVGLNQYSEVLTMQDKYREHFAAMKYEEEGGVAHHIYLLTAAEMGWFGMYFFIAIIGLLTGTMIISGFPMRTLEQRLLMALAIGFFVLFAIGLYEWVLRQSPVLYQFTIAAGLGQALVARVKEARHKPENNHEVQRQAEPYKAGQS
jgi:hypothetical protein